MSRVLTSNPSAPPRRGEVYWADLDPVIGTELGRKVRPVVIVSVDDFNQEGDKVVIVPSTTVARALPTRVRWPVRTSTGQRDSYFCCEDVRAISVLRLYGRIGEGIIPAAVLESIVRVLRSILGLRAAQLES